MDIACFRNEDGACPVKQYLEQLPTEFKAYIDARIALVAQHNGVLPPYTKPITGYSFQQLQKLKKNNGHLIRVLYVRHKNTMLLLLVFDKIERKVYGQKEQREIIAHYNQAEEFSNKYHLDNNLYESYELSH